MLQGSAFSALAFSGLALWFGVRMIRRPERRIDAVIFGLVAST